VIAVDKITIAVESGSIEILLCPKEIEGALHAALRDPDGNSIEFIQAR